eukprot:TRINITY_DN6033_c0_g1_i1.p1 TRINITY_DN6033_c0_g1~~TRINITY_DN6033_c0_g1_i1.p1  ORF type:complete len:135 (+),score=19.14 TRINITY_DN6033_c0_g1_i1:61-465(+)
MCIRDRFSFDPNYWNVIYLTSNERAQLINVLGRSLGKVISERLELISAKSRTLLEKRREGPVDFSVYFLLRENLALLWNSIGAYNEALRIYEELRLLYRETKATQLSQARTRKSYHPQHGSRGLQRRTCPSRSD